MNNYNFHSSYLRTPELHISIFIKQQQARWAHPRPGRSERITGPLLEREREREREGARAYSQTAAHEREAILNTLHKVYIDRSLAFSGAKTICQQGQARSGSLTLRLPVLQGCQF